MKINGQPLHKLKKAYKAARKACGLLNTLPDSAYRTTSRHKLFGRMNRLRAAINRHYATYNGVEISHTNKHGFHVYINNVKSNGYPTISECKKLVDTLYKNYNQRMVMAA